ncbi:MAG TPA: ATP-binding protein [Victivallales bacterium]|nr:ATP-binding protein [Victivallales bacterium]
MSYFVKAVYSKQDITDYTGNPFIEALPKIWDESEVYELLDDSFVISNEELTQPYHIRIHNIQKILDVFLPLNHHFDLQYKISVLIRRGYVGRNPLNAEFTKDINNGIVRFKNNDFKARKYQTIAKTARCLSLIGISGIGKSYTLAKILSGYEQVIFHEKYNLYQVVYLHVECPSKSTKQLCIKILVALDNALGTNYSTILGGKNYNNIATDPLKVKVAQICMIHGVGLLVIDEIQNLSVKGSGGKDEMLNFFVDLENSIGIPIVLVGTPKAMGIINHNFRQARRSSGIGSILWDRFEIGEMWQDFIEQMLYYQWFIKPINYSKELSNLIYHHTQGITDLVVKLLLLSQLFALASKKEYLDLNIIDKTAKKYFKPMDDFLNALRSGNPDLIRQYDDIKPLNIDNAISDLQVLASNIDLKKMREKSKNTKTAKPKISTDIESTKKDSPVVLPDYLLEENACYNDYIQSGLVKDPREFAGIV